MTLDADQQAEIDAARAETRETGRATVPGLEAVLFQPFPVLDHGFVRVVDYMGDDSSIVQAARVSYGRGTRKVSEDAGLINYLMRHRHTSPFEMAEIKLHVKLPIFVARQWIRHRTASVNEYSARYSVLDREVYIPAAGHVAAQARDNKQGRAGALDETEAAEVLDILRADARRCHDDYEHMLNQDADGAPLDPARSGVARELARINLTLNTYPQWYWKVDLHNFMHFLALRAHPHAQYEIRAYARTLLDILDRWVPVTAAAFREHRLDGAHLSATALDVVRRLLAGDTVTREDSGLGRREWNELMAVLYPHDGSDA